ncbi:MAG: hypothetical protein QXK15_04350 [Candidatus Bathyarchaeia archaeon]
MFYGRKAFFMVELTVTKLKLMELVKSTLSLIKIFSIKCHEEEILTIAEKLQLTFYDALCFYAKK